MDGLSPEYIANLLEKNGIPAAVGLTALSGGRNNRAYRLDTINGTFLLKWYYQGGDWDRLAAESGFLRFCERAKVGRVPRLIAEDRANGVAIHSWFEGEWIGGKATGEADVREVARFLDELYHASRGFVLSDVPHARDAYRCLEDAFRSPRERLADLERSLVVNGSRPIFGEALSFYRGVLLPYWQRASETVFDALSGKDLHRPFSAATLIVSPSDLGFHNALRLRDGGLGFVDFEYSGLDCIIKLLGDFICQPTHTLPKNPKETLYIMARVCRDAQTVDLVGILLPLFTVKFCCIILNDFKAADRDRRFFASPGRGTSHHAEQLQKVQRYLSNMACR